MRSAAHLAGMVRIVETDEDAVQTCVFVPPDDQHTIQFSGRTIRVNFVNQCCAASGDLDMDDAVPRTAVGKDFSTLHRLHRIPIAHQRLGEPFHFGDWAALIGRTSALRLLRRSMS